MKTVNSVDQFQIEYEKGVRRFLNCELDKSSFSNINLSGAVFEGCFLSVNFNGANCENTKFLKCNLKTADFNEANLKNAVIQGCSVEYMSLKGAIVESLVFKDNHFMGSIMGQNNLDEFL